MKRATLDALVAAQESRARRVRVVSLSTGNEALIAEPSELSELEEAEFAAHEPKLAEVVAKVLAGDRGRLVQIDSDSDSISDSGAADAPSFFVHPFNPRPRLIIVGAVHIAQRLARLALGLGYDVLVIDPRRGFLTESRFPGVARSHEWPDVAVESAGLDGRSALVALSHDPKIDQPALEVALRSDCFYIGALGSQRTQAKRRARLAELGFDEAALARIHGPVGLDIGASSPAEIALSIAAELTECLRKRA
ncbi:MAG: XdhC family protein [Myxococcota bacterium]